MYLGTFFCTAWREMWLVGLHPSCAVPVPFPLPFWTTECVSDRTTDAMEARPDLGSGMTAAA